MFKIRKKRKESILITKRRLSVKNNSNTNDIIYQEKKIYHKTD